MIIFSKLQNDLPVQHENEYRIFFSFADWYSQLLVVMLISRNVYVYQRKKTDMERE